MAEDSLADFSNDLASDLGPLLALFGESMTIQYLSESTSFLDYLIFAMGPIGIVTAMVSVIRVCGHSSLKAFIGRSQEGDGVVETELCTSTSRDVCEVFNRNGVTRVLGRPRVLELVYVRSDPRKLFLFKHYLRATESWDWKVSSRSISQRAERHHPADVGAGHTEDVEANLDGQIVIERPETKSIGTKSSEVTDLHDAFAPTPNLSLNVGIVRRPSWFYVVVAMTGVVLQSGVLVLAAVGHWVLGWNVSDEGNRGSGDYAPVMFITGTVLLCGGMWACAALIGHITEETWYARKSEPDSPRSSSEYSDNRLSQSGFSQSGPSQSRGSTPRPFRPPASRSDSFQSETDNTPTSLESFEGRPSQSDSFQSSATKSQHSQLLWLQPGPQTIGDQTFDPFVYFESDKSPLRLWASSKKITGTTSELYTFIAVPLLLAGYIVQFIGLRGLRAWVSLSQLGVTVTMSILRGLLRMQRLRKEDNELRQISHVVASYELEWLAFKIDQCDKDSTDLHGRHIAYGDNKKPYTPYADLLRIRARLAHLTGVSSFAVYRTEEMEVYDRWEDDYVEVRAKARTVSAAICLLAEKLFEGKKAQDHLQRLIDEWDNAEYMGINTTPKPTIPLRVRRFVLPVEKLLDGACVEVCPPDETLGSSWTVDSAQIEAMLGLAMWTLVTDDSPPDAKVDSESRDRVASNVRCARAVSAGPDDAFWSHRVDIQPEMDLWLGSNSMELSTATLPQEMEYENDILALWVRPTAASDIDALSLMSGKLSRQLPPYASLVRLAGQPWRAHPLDTKSRSTESSKLVEQEGESRKVDRIQVAPTNAPLLDLCSQDLFTLLAQALVGRLPFSNDDTTIFDVQDGIARLRNPTVGKIAQAFTESGLGSYTDALLCIIPAFRGKFRLSDPEHRRSALEAAATAYRHTFEWKKAETLLEWEFRRCHRLLYEEESFTLDACSHFGEAFRALLQHYRWMIADTSSIHIRKRGISGIRLMVKRTRTRSDPDPGENASLWSKAMLAERPILESYAWVAEKVSTFDGAQIPYETATSVHEEFVGALQDGIRHNALFQLCIINQKDLRSDLPSSALPLAIRQTWYDIASVLLEMEVSVNGKDSSGRTALSYCAELGLEELAKLLIDKEADCGLLDNCLRAPLSWAAKSGHDRLVELLNREDKEVINILDVDHKSPLRWAIDGRYGSTAWLLIRLGAAAQPPCENMGKFLDDAGVFDSEAKGPFGLATMMRIAAMDGHRDIAEQLLSRGACINELHHGSTPLTLAAENGHESMVQLLVDHGADLDLQNAQDQTPLRRALSFEHLTIARFLFEKGASLDAAGVTDDEKRLLLG